MLFDVQGTVEVAAWPPELLHFSGDADDQFSHRSFSHQVFADSDEEEALIPRVNGTLQFFDPSRSFQNCRITGIRRVTFSQFGDVGDTVFNKLSQLWLRQNRQLLLAGFAQDTLWTPERIPYSQPGAGPCIYCLHPDTNKPLTRDGLQLFFPLEILPHIARAANNDAEAEIAAILCCERIQVLPEMEADGDHHSPYYCQDRYWSFALNLAPAFALARDTEGLREQLAQYVVQPEAEYLYLEDLCGSVEHAIRDVNEQLDEPAIVKGFPMGSAIYLSSECRVQRRLLSDIDIVLFIGPTMDQPMRGTDTDLKLQIKQLFLAKMSRQFTVPTQVTVYSREEEYLRYMQLCMRQLTRKLPEGLIPSHQRWIPLSTGEDKIRFIKKYIELSLMSEGVSQHYEIVRDALLTCEQPSDYEILESTVRRMLAGPPFTTWDERESVLHFRSYEPLVKELLLLQQ